MKNINSAILIFILILCSCKREIKQGTDYLRWIGDIEQNDEIDKSEFTVCNGNDNILQYFNFRKGAVYNGEKSRIINFFNSKYKPVTGKNQDGFIRIRFIVNCQGIAGRYRILQSDENYQPQEFDEKITSQLIEITREIENWEVLEREDFPIDYYMYLVFKIDDGAITEILP
ncbi:hypothetical protein LDL76_12545 [Salegentibacter mishustinae]|uniref:hypothetical protein n=1 Tax=Salegentibacter mishustinae TaxID=270918 RepID=UPI001CE21281|nr:hypothetical protein [Salegentibacter mishustinae]UBZ06185.1 hypothetical protein LDL76_12545 [Salegentibacter mishustinae]